MFIWRAILSENCPRRCHGPCRALGNGFGHDDTSGYVHELCKKDTTPTEYNAKNIKLYAPGVEIVVDAELDCVSELFPDPEEEE